MRALRPEFVVAKLAAVAPLIAAKVLTLAWLSSKMDSIRTQQVVVDASAEVFDLRNVKRQCPDHCSLSSLM